VAGQCAAERPLLLLLAHNQKESSMRMPTHNDLYPREPYKLPRAYQWLVVAIAAALACSPLFLLLI
jgi:hypothetical protein